MTQAHTQVDCGRAWDCQIWLKQRGHGLLHCMAAAAQRHPSSCCVAGYLCHCTDAVDLHWLLVLEMVHMCQTRGWPARMSINSGCRLPCIVQQFMR